MNRANKEKLRKILARERAAGRAEGVEDCIQIVLNREEHLKQKAHQAEPRNGGMIMCANEAFFYAEVFRGLANDLRRPG